MRKKAALTLLRLYRKHPDVIPAKEWALRIVSIMDDPDLVSVFNAGICAWTHTCIGRSFECDQPYFGPCSGPSGSVCYILPEGSGQAESCKYNIPGAFDLSL